MGQLRAVDAFAHSGVSDLKAMGAPSALQPHAKSQSSRTAQSGRVETAPFSDLSVEQPPTPGRKDRLSAVQLLLQPEAREIPIVADGADRRSQHVRRLLQRASQKIPQINHRGCARIDLLEPFQQRRQIE
jgi:hypothetical protein